MQKLYMSSVAARLCKKLKKNEKRFKLQIGRLFNKLKKKISAQNTQQNESSTESSPLRSPRRQPTVQQTPKNDIIPGTPHHIPPNTAIFIEDIQKNAKISKNKPKWPKVTLCIC